MSVVELKYLFAIDPGTTESAYVIIDVRDGEIISKGKLFNDILLGFIELWDKPDTHLCIEMIASYGMAVGKTVFETCVFIGRILELWNHKDFCNYPLLPKRMYRRDVKINLCGSMKAKDSNIRQAIIDRYPATGGGKLPQVGIKSAPGPLFGVSKDIWAALGVGLTFLDAASGRFELTEI